MRFLIGVDNERNEFDGNRELSDYWDAGEEDYPREDD